jgi:colanic acid biosynthesis glycosyl transferase WcaI
VACSQYGESSLVLALGARMGERVAPYLSGKSRLEWVPLWGPAASAVTREEREAFRSRRSWSPNQCVLLYSGNMGLGHRLDEFLAAAGQTGSGGPIWAFTGGGRRRAEVERFVADHPASRVELHPYVAEDELAVALASADVHLVSLREGWEGLIVPSKLQAAFAAGRPVIFVGPRKSESADWVLASGGGWVVSPGDVEGLLKCVSAAQDPAERARRGELGLQYAQEHFDRSRNVARVAELLEASGREVERSDS